MLNKDIPVACNYHSCGSDNSVNAVPPARRDLDVTCAFKQNTGNGKSKLIQQTDMLKSPRHSSSNFLVCSKYRKEVNRVRDKRRRLLRIEVSVSIPEVIFYRETLSLCEGVNLS